MEHADLTHAADVDTDVRELPNSLNAILSPEAAIAAAERMQRWYRSSPQGVAHSLFGRDGRRVSGRLPIETLDEPSVDADLRDDRDGDALPS